jgi:glycosyltransferase involved in cell wall biosynthesis/GT2 family glycosyltransferase
MKVLHAIHDFLPRHRAGSELYLFHLAREQARRHEVQVLCAEYDPTREHASLCAREHEGLPVLEIVNNWTFGSFAESYRSPAIDAALGRALDLSGADVLHVHNLLNLSFALPALARARGMATVATLHDYTLVCPSGGQRVHRAERHTCLDIDVERCARCFAQSPFYAQMAPTQRRARPAPVAPLEGAQVAERLADMRRATEAVDLFVAPSRALASDMQRFGLPPERVRVSDYGFAPLGAAPRTARPPGAPLRIGFVGTLVWHKGAHVLIQAARLLPPGAFELRLFGDTATFPDYVRDLRAAARGLPVAFEGGFAPAAAAEAYARMDVLVVPSLWPENSPLVIHEAFQAGLPVVAARTGGIPELLSDGVNGLLYAPSSASELAGALRTLIDEPARLARLAAARPAVKTIGQDAGEWEAVYAGALARRPAPPGARARPAPLVSIVIPTLNGAATLPAALDAIAAQRAEFDFEVVAVDSGSTDGTVELLAGRTDRLLRVPPGTFNHGLTRNHGIADSRGELVVLLVQDAVPASERWLAELVAPLREDSAVAGSYARQIPRAGASALTRHYLADWVACGASPRTSALSFDDFQALEPLERYLRCCFDNVCSCLRRRVWELHPFVPTAIAEDAEWAREVLLAGHRLAYAPAAAVVHSHERPARYELWRTYLVHQRLRRLFGVRTVPTAWHLLRGVGSSLPLHLRCVAADRPPAGARVSAVARALALAFAFPIGQYLGALSADTGLDLLRPRGV